MQKGVDPTIQKRFSAWGLTERVAFARDALLVGFNFGGGVFSEERMLLLIPLLFEKHGKSDISIRLPFWAGEGWLVLGDGNDLSFKAFYNNYLNDLKIICFEFCKKKSKLSNHEKKRC